MINIDLQDLIYLTEDLINLFLSGFIFVTLFNWLTNRQMDLYIIGIWSLFVNALIKTFYTALHSVVFVQKDFNEAVKIMIYVVTAIILAFAIVRIRSSTHIKKLLGKFYKKTINKDFLYDVIDYNRRTMMMIYLKNSDFYYLGVFRLHEEKGSESYITLIDYCLCTKEDDEILRDFTEQKASVSINLQDIECIEMVYENDSATWQWLNQNNNNEETQEQES